MLFEYFDWYTNPTPTALQRLIRVVLFVPTILFFASCALLAISCMILLVAIALLWMLVAALPYWICTNTTAPKCVKEHILEPVAKFIED